jgi:glycosyltransferase involved in cell wall biosynthesis
LRLGVYADLVYRRVDGRLSADLPFVHFVAAMAPRLTELVVFGRLDPTPRPHPNPLPADRIRFVPLPHYPRVTDAAAVMRSLRSAVRTFSAELGQLDAVWLFGPHPVALAFVGAAARRRTPVVLGIRQDYPSYISNRVKSRARLSAVAVAHGLEQAFRQLSRRFPTVVVGSEIARNYRHGNAPLLVTGFSLIRKADIVDLGSALTRPWDGPLRVLSVGRLDPEKNPLLLPAIAAELRLRDPRWRLAVAGDGQLFESVSRRVADLDLADTVELLGGVPQGPELTALYRASHALLHVSFTEGIPQVLFEGQAAGLPIVATDVGGVAAALGRGEAGLLVPPNDVLSAVDALERLRTSERLRRELIEAGLARVSSETIDAHLDRLMSFLESSVNLAPTRVEHA